jgi:hypothetical protein
LYLPLTYLTEAQAAGVMLVVNVGLIALALWVAAREYLSRFDVRPDALYTAVVILLALLLDLDKTKGEIQMWQTNGLIVLMFALALRWLDRRPIWAGGALGVALNIKYISIVMLPYLLLRRRWKAAGAFMLWSVGLALLPAVVSGWEQNRKDLTVAFGGIMKLVGVDQPHEEKANIEAMAASFSCSVTSAYARAFRRQPQLSLTLAGLTACAAAGVALMMYRRQRLPAILWPGDVSAQMKQPYRAMVGVEWATLMAAFLIFSPQTNTRHLVDVLMVTTCAAVMVLGAPRGVPRWPLILGLLILVAGFNLPPGRRDVPALSHALGKWLGVGGPCWCLLVLCFALIWTGLRCANDLAAKDAVTSPAPKPISEPALA